MDSYSLLDPANIDASSSIIGDVLTSNGNQMIWSSSEHCSITNRLPTIPSKVILTCGNNEIVLSAQSHQFSQIFQGAPLPTLLLRALRQHVR